MKQANVLDGATVPRGSRWGATPVQCNTPLLCMLSKVSARGVVSRLAIVTGDYLGIDWDGPWGGGALAGHGSRASGLSWRHLLPKLTYMYAVFG